MQKSSQNIPLVFSFDATQHPIGKSAACEYFYRYLSEINVKTYVLEENYIDKDFLIDYSKFYARSFVDHKKFTTRYHFFASSFADKEFKKALISQDELFFERLQKTYCGFIVTKPIENTLGQKLIGKSLIAPYPDEDNGEKRVFVKNKFNVSLFGIPLKIVTLPFQEQDPAVGACATIACWISLYPLVNLFGIPMFSPYEVTERSVGFPSDCRNFPSEGLTIHQMKNYFNSIGLETEFVDPQQIQKSDTYQKKTDDVVAETVRAYNEIGLPVIAGLELYKDPKNMDEIPDYHAVVISGYRHKTGLIKELYVHDDRIGPYSFVEPISNSFLSWKNEWLNEGYSKIIVNKLLVPIYPKIRLSFLKIYGVFLHHKRFLETLIKKGTLDKKSRCELFLTDVRNYKKFLLGKQFENKVEILSEPFPRFLWIIRVEYDGTPHYDYVYDGTSVAPNNKTRKIIVFNYENHTTQT